MPGGVIDERERKPRQQDSIDEVEAGVLVLETESEPDEVYQPTTERVEEFVRERRRSLNRRLSCLVLGCLLTIVVLCTLAILSFEVEELQGLQGFFDILSLLPRRAERSLWASNSTLNSTECC